MRPVSSVSPGVGEERRLECTRMLPGVTFPLRTFFNQPGDTEQVTTPDLPLMINENISLVPEDVDEGYELKCYLDRLMVCVDCA